jgi:hypothetical protein
MLRIEGKAVGRKKPLFADWSVPLPPGPGDGGEPLTLRALVGLVVRAEVAAFRQRQEERKLIRALTARDIEAGAARGKVDMGGRDLKQPVDEEEAVVVAVQAFADGLYLVIVDGEEQRDLDREVHVQADSRVTFVRLAMLAGG